MNILIIGGNRFVGKALSRSLCVDYSVDVFNRSGTGHDGVSIIKGDRNTERDLNKIPFEKYNVIVDMCLFKPEQFELIKNKIDVFKTHYIFISSGAAYKNTNLIPISESFVLGGMKSFNTYGVDKSECERLIKETKIDHTILRPAYIDGIGSHIPRMAEYFYNLLKGKKFHVTHHKQSFVLVQDMVKCVVSVILNRQITSREAYNICNDDFMSMHDLASVIQKFLKTKKSHFTCSETNTLFAPINFILTNEKIKTDLGIQFESIPKSLEQFYQWFLEQGVKTYGYDL